MGFIYTKYIITCDEHIINDDGSISFIRAFDNKILSKIPTEIDFCLAISLEYTLSRKEDREIFIRIVDEEGNNGSESGIDQSHDFNFKLRSTKKDEVNNVVSIINIKNLTIDKEGIYSIFVYRGEEIVAKQDILFSKESE